MGWLFRNTRGHNISTAQTEVSVHTDIPSDKPANVYFIVDGELITESEKSYIDLGVKDSFLVYSHTRRASVYSKQQMHHFYRFIG